MELSFLQRFRQQRKGPLASLQGTIDAMQAGQTNTSSQPTQQATQQPTQTTQPAQQPIQVQGFQKAIKDAQAKIQAGNQDPMSFTQQSLQSTQSAPDDLLARTAKDAADESLFQQEGEEALSEYEQYLQDVVGRLEAPISVAEQKKRERAAHAIAGVGAMGNVLNAFSNLIFAGEAPSQTLPQNVDAGAAVDRERKRWDQIRNAYVSGGLSKAKAKYDLWRERDKDRRTAQNEEFEREYKRRSLELREKDLQRLLEKQDYERQYRDKKLSLEEIKLDLQERKLAVDAAYKNGMLGVAQYRAAIADIEVGIKWYNAQVNAGGSEKGTTISTTGPLGTETKTVTTTTKKPGADAATTEGRPRAVGSGKVVNGWDDPEEKVVTDF